MPLQTGERLLLIPSVRLRQPVRGRPGRLSHRGLPVRPRSRCRIAGSVRPGQAVALAGGRRSRCLLSSRRCARQASLMNSILGARHSVPVVPTVSGRLHRRWVRMLCVLLNNGKGDRAGLFGKKMWQRRLFDADTRIPSHSWRINPSAKSLYGRLGSVRHRRNCSLRG